MMADNTDLGAPLTPADCDLRDFPFIPIDIVRLFGSEFHAAASDPAWRAGVTLWLKSWHQVPAGSLPDDDAMLARLAELGRDIRGWKKCKAEALHGWERCSDGRLYHRVVAEKALEAWLEKLRQRLASGAGNAKRWNAEFDRAPIDADVERAKTLLSAIAPNSRAIAKAMRMRSPADPTGIPPGSQSDRKGQGQGQGYSSVGKPTGADAPSDPKKALFDAGVALLTGVGQAEPGARRVIGKWCRDHGEGPVHEAILSATGKADPVSWIEGRLRKKTSVDDEARALSAATAERYRRMNIQGPPPGWGGNA
jgi:hypothetical protein